MLSTLAAAQLTAWATLGLAILALIAAIFALLAWKAQDRQINALQGQLDSQQQLADEQRKLNAEQLPVLRQQAQELQASLQQREHEAQERREQHVNRVFIWTEPRSARARTKQPDESYAYEIQWTVSIYLKNAGYLPVYDVTFSWRVGDLPGETQHIKKPVMPGEREVTGAWNLPPGITGENVTVVAFIRDTAENRWRVHADGRHDLLSPEEWPPRAW